jgi:hypothetical protein
MRVRHHVVVESSSKPRAHQFSSLHCLSLCLYFVALTGHAEGLPIDIETEATYKTWNLELKPNFLNAATPQQRKVIEDVRFSVIATKDFNAHSIADTHQIVIPVGVTFTIDAVSVAYSIISIHHECFDSFPPFFAAVLKTYRREDDENPGMYPVLNRYCTQLPTVLAGEEASLRQQLIGYSIVNSMAVIVAHELGHVFYGDYSRKKPPSTFAERRAIEMRADDFAFTLALKAGYSPYITFGIVFPVFAALEDPDEAAGADNHPPAYCRELKLMDKMNGDPTVLAMLRSMTTDQRRSMQELISMAYMNAKNNCPQ